MRTRPYSTISREVARLLGLRVREARIERRMRVEELAERVGCSHVTIRKVERGELTVGLGVALEAAFIVGVPLFSPEPDRRRVELRRVEDRLALLPKAARELAFDDDF